MAQEFDTIKIITDKHPDLRDDYPGGNQKAFRMLNGKYVLGWKEKPVIEPLTDHEISSLLTRMQLAGQNGEVNGAFHFSLDARELRFVKEQVHCFVKEITDDTANGLMWCIIGVDKAAAVREYAKI